VYVLLYITVLLPVGVIIIKDFYNTGLGENHEEDCSPELYSNHQHAFRPTGSTTAANITILHKVTHLLVNNPNVIVIAIDYSKAFDTVRYSTLLAKMAQLDIPDCTYNWLVDFFNGHSRHTKYDEQTST